MSSLRLIEQDVEPSSGSLFVSSSEANRLFVHSVYPAVRQFPGLSCYRCVEGEGDRRPDRQPISGKIDDMLAQARVT
jgi:hypothetical protein